MLHYSKFLRDNAMTNHSSPTCVVTFADKQVTRMTVWSADGEPDLRRGIHLAWAAYESRTKRFPPAITALHFEVVHFEVSDGATVTTTQFTAEQIAEATDDR
jgi:hypothetical protein